MSSLVKPSLVKPSTAMTKVACIGECMSELRQASGQELLRGYGGDTLNTAVYLARLGLEVDYITALGDDPISDEMVAGWAAEGGGTREGGPRPANTPRRHQNQNE